MIFSREEDCDEDGMAPLGGDCDDLVATVFAGAEELCDGLDNDSDLAGDASEDEDSDGYDVCSDCAPHNPLIYPGAEERCNGVRLPHKECAPSCGSSYCAMLDRETFVGHCTLFSSLCRSLGGPNGAADEPPAGRTLVD